MRYYSPVLWLTVALSKTALGPITKKALWFFLLIRFKWTDLSELNTFIMEFLVALSFTNKMLNSPRSLRSNGVVRWPLQVRPCKLLASCVNLHFYPLVLTWSVYHIRQQIIFCILPRKRKNPLVILLLDSNFTKWTKMDSYFIWYCF